MAAVVSLKERLLDVSGRFLLFLGGGDRSMLVSSSSPPDYFIIFQTSTAAFSFLSSSLMAISIALFGNVGLSTPYRRIIFGLSICDILQSFAFLSGPFAVPPSKISVSVADEAISCRANGFLLSTGSTAVMMYTLFLSFYYLCKLKWRMHDQDFRYNAEMKINAVIVSFSVALNIIALAMNTFHTNAVFQSFCSFAEVPTGCRITMFDDVGSCDESNTPRIRVFIYIVNVILPALCLLGIIVTMSLLYNHAIVLNRAIELDAATNVKARTRRRKLRKLRNSKPAEEDHNKEQEDVHLSVNDEETPRRDSNNDMEESTSREETPQDRVQNLSRLYRREITIQATLYVGAFCITYLPMIIGFIVTTFYIYSNPLSAFGIFTLPLGGFFNILVYTRPKVSSLRRRHPTCSRLRGFWLVLKAGGEIPSDTEVLSPNCLSWRRNDGGSRTGMVSEHESRTLNLRNQASRRLPSFRVRLNRIGLSRFQQD